MQSNYKNFRVVFFLILLTWTLAGLLGPMVKEVAASLPNTNQMQVGLVTAIFLIVASGLSFVWVILEDRFSRKKLLICATSCWVLAIFLVYFTSSYFELFFLHMIAAVGYAAIFPIGFSITMDYIVPEERATAFSMLGIAGTVGIGFSYILGGILIDFFDWRVPFLILSLLGCVVIMFLFSIEDPKKGSQEKELTHLLSSGMAYSYHIKRGDLCKLVKNKANPCLIAYNFLLFFARGGISFFIITMLKNDYSFSSTVATLLVIGTYGTMIAGNIFWGKRADKKFAMRADGKVKVLLEALLIGPGFLIIAYSMQFSLAQIGLIVIFAILLAIGAFNTSALTSISNSILGEVNPPELRATAFSFNNFAQTIGRSISIAVMAMLYFLFVET